MIWPAAAAADEAAQQVEPLRPPERLWRCAAVIVAREPRAPLRHPFRLQQKQNRRNAVETTSTTVALAGSFVSFQRLLNGLFQPHRAALGGLRGFKRRVARPRQLLLFIAFVGAQSLSTGLNLGK
jgi:hypothetical protein